MPRKYGPKSSKRGAKRSGWKRGFRGRRSFGSKRLGPSSDGAGSMSVGRPLGTSKKQEMRGIIALYQSIAAPYSKSIVARPDSDYSTTLLTCFSGFNSDVNCEWWFGVPHLVANSPFYIAMKATYAQVKLVSVTLSYIPMNLQGVAGADVADSWPGTVTFAPDTSENQPAESTGRTCSQNFATQSSRVVNYAQPWTLTIPLSYKPALVGAGGAGSGAQQVTASSWIDLDLLTQQWKYLSGLMVFTIDRAFAKSAGIVGNGSYSFGHVSYSVNCVFRGKPDAVNMHEPSNSEVPGITE